MIERCSTVIPLLVLVVNMVALIVVAVGVGRIARATEEIAGKIDNLSKV